MAYAHPLDVLGDPTRRRIFERLREWAAGRGRAGRRTPGQPPRGLPAPARPEGGGAGRRPEGRRAPALRGGPGRPDRPARLVRRILERRARRAYKDAAERKAREEDEQRDRDRARARAASGVDCSVEEAWEVFTTGICTWWPTETHSIGGRGRPRRRLRGPGRAARSTRWPPTGRGSRGRTCSSGSRRTGSCWPGTWARRAREPTEVEVRFTPYDDGAGTRVELEHRHVGALGGRRVGARATTTRAGSTCSAASPSAPAPAARRRRRPAPRALRPRGAPAAAREAGAARTARSKPRSRAASTSGSP